MHRKTLNLISFVPSQAELQGKVAELEGQVRAERKAQRDLKLVLAAAERQSQSDCSDKTDLSAKCAP